VEKRIDVLTIGDLCVDLIVSGKAIVPEFGQKEKLVEDYALEMGGSCSIFACQTAKLGLKTAVIGKVGPDAFGELIVNTLKQSGVSTDYIITTPHLKTGLTVILNRITDRAILTYNGTIDSVSLVDIPDELLQSVRHFHIGSYFLMKQIQPHYPDLIKRLKHYGTTVSLDTNWDPEERWDSGLWDILPFVDVFLPNENEALAITREPDLDHAVKKLREIVPVVVLKKGKDGAVVYTEHDRYVVSSLNVHMVDAVGAGDSFDGGFVYGFVSGKTLEECARIGAICGSLNVTEPGGTRGQPVLEEMMRYR
jgi:sugar/nucleoside kinase (ribokinase family)